MWTWRKKTGVAGTSEFNEFRALCSKGAYRDAYTALRTVMAAQPQWAKVGDLYVWCADLELIVNDDVPKAAEFLSTAVRLGCMDMAGYYSTHGYVLWRQGEREGGIQDLEKSVELVPSIAHLAELGQVLSSDGDERAKGIWERILREDAKNCQAHIYIGREEAKCGNRDKALTTVRKAERLASISQEFVEIGRLYHELYEFETAIGAYLKAESLRQEPKGPLYAAIALCYFSLGDREAGQEYLDWAMKHNPEHEYVRYAHITNLVRRGQALSSEGDQRATGIWQQALREDPKNCLGHIYLGREEAKCGNRDKALLMVEEAELFATLAQEFFEVGRFYYELDEFEAALRAYSRAEKVGLEPKGPLYAAIAACHFSLSDNEAGCKYIGLAMKYSPEDEYVKYVFEQSPTQQ